MNYGSDDQDREPHQTLRHSVALANLNLEINEGDCFGFIGPNGAGKSTTIKILATLLQPTWGEGASVTMSSDTSRARFAR